MWRLVIDRTGIYVVKEVEMPVIGVVEVKKYLPSGEHEVRALLRRLRVERAGAHLKAITLEFEDIGEAGEGRVQAGAPAEATKVRKVVVKAEEDVDKYVKAIMRELEAGKGIKHVALALKLPRSQVLAVKVLLKAMKNPDKYQIHSLEKVGELCGRYLIYDKQANVLYAVKINPRSGTYTIVQSLTEIPKLMKWGIIKNKREAEILRRIYYSTVAKPMVVVEKSESEDEKRIERVRMERELREDALG